MQRPKSFGMVLYPEFELLDVGGTLEALNMLARVIPNDTITLSILAKTMDPVTPGPIFPDTISAAFAGHQIWLPTHTFDNAPPLDVLLVPGGLGTYNPPAGYPPLPSGGVTNNSDIVDFIRDRYPSLQYLISICTGAALVAQSGVLDGHNATTNKAQFNETASFGPKVNWIAQARWVVSGNIWTTSGVSAGTDGVLAWIEALYGNETVTDVVNQMEWNRVTDPLDDPFATVWNDVDIPPVE